MKTPNEVPLRMVLVLQISVPGLISTNLSSFLSDQRSGDQEVLFMISKETTELISVNR